MAAPPDLLRERRMELGLSPGAPFHEPLVQLLTKGAIVATAPVIVCCGVFLLLQARHQSLQQQVRALEPIEQRVGTVKSQLQTMASRRGALETQTREIAAQLVAVRSGSALLEQLRRVTPQQIQLVSVAAQPSKLVIKGAAQGPDAFARLNALVLNLQALPEMAAGATSVTKASSDDGGQIDFSLDGAIDSQHKPTSERLLALGAEGLARRYELLKAKGIDP